MRFLWPRAAPEEPAESDDPSRYSRRDVPHRRLRFRRPLLPDGSDGLRREVRACLRGQRYEPRCDSWLSGFDPEFSRALAARGWVGMTWPERYGGGGRSPLDRHVVIEELLAAGAPVAAHWISDRQTASASAASAWPRPTPAPTRHSSARTPPAPAA